MRLLFKLDGRIEDIDNVSIDDKCFPLVSGKHPYSESSCYTTPLTHRSAVWFKTLALDSVYVNCDKRQIFWTPVVNDVDVEQVVLRRRASNIPDGTFVPPQGRPLFDDISLYDLNASLKEMMGKCQVAAHKFFTNKITAAEFNNIAANLLHVYILPSVTFSNQDMYCLSRTRCLIEHRLHKLEQDILNRANGIETLQRCMDTLKQNFLERDDFESEKYLRTCNREFLKVFLKKISEEIESLNFTLEAEQSKVNWAKQHQESSSRVEQLQEQRNSVYRKVEVLIKVREGIKNVILRKTKLKRKKKKAQIIDSCFHNVFIEIDRRLEVDNLILSQLCIDKVNICAAREATISAIQELDNNNRSSDRVTRFQPDDEVDYHFDSTKLEKTGIWLTFEERVSKVLEDPTSIPYNIHKQGCDNLKSRIGLALSEFYISMNEGDIDIEETAVADKGVDGHLGGSPVHYRYKARSTLSTEERRKRRAVVLSTEEDDTESTQVKSYEETEDCILLGPEVNPGEMEGFIFQEDHYRDSGCENHSPSDLSLSRILLHDGKAEESCQRHVNEVNEDGREVACNQYSQQSRAVQHVALTVLMSSIETIKQSIQLHFFEVIESLHGHVRSTSLDTASISEEKEQLWKTYERFFCTEVLFDLEQLYSMSLTKCSQDAHHALTSTSMFDLLDRDPILDIIFAENRLNNDTCTDSLSQTSDKISMAKTLSNLSVDMRCCSINDLYSLANADSDDLCKRFNLETKEDVVAESPSSSESGASVKSSDLFDDENSASLTSSLDTLSAAGYSSGVETSSKTCDQGVDDNVKACLKMNTDTSLCEASFNSKDNKMSQNPEIVICILDSLLSSFRKYITRCLEARTFLDKVRYITRAVEELNTRISQLYRPSHLSACDDIISMLVLALCNMPEDIFVQLYINLRMVTDVMPSFLNGTLWDYNLVSLFASYDYLFSRNVCGRVMKRYPSSFKVKTLR